MNQNELISDALEALELLDILRPVYIHLLEKHGKEEALKIMIFFRDNYKEISHGLAS